MYVDLTLATVVTSQNVATDTIVVSDPQWAHCTVWRPVMGNCVAASDGQMCGGQWRVTVWRPVLGKCVAASDGQLCGGQWRATVWRPVVGNCVAASGGQLTETCCMEQKYAAS
jgi:hypothetical protein